MALHDDGARALEAPAPQACQARSAKAQASPLSRQPMRRRSDYRTRCPSLAARAIHDATPRRSPAGADQPRPIVLPYSRSATRRCSCGSPVDLRHSRPSYPAATVTGVRGSFQVVLLMIAVFYGGELVWRERDRQINEIIDSTPCRAGYHRAEDHRDLRRPADRQRRGDADRPMSTSSSRAPTIGIGHISPGSWSRRRSTRC